MRPRKRILLVDANPERLSIRRLVLEIARFKVLSAENHQEALACAKQLPDAIVMVMPIPNAPALIEALHGAAPGISSLAILEDGHTPSGEAALGFLADVMLPANTPAFYLLERLFPLAARKRGPRKKPAVSMPLVEAELRRLA